MGRKIDVKHAIPKQVMEGQAEEPGDYYGNEALCADIQPSFAGFFQSELSPYVSNTQKCLVLELPAFFFVR